VRIGILLRNIRRKGDRIIANEGNSKARGECNTVKKSLGAKTLLYPTPVMIIGSYDAKDTPNVMTAAWGGICCSDPPCVAISLRKATLTYRNIMERKAFTISTPSADHVREADYFGLVSGKDEDKFSHTGLTAERSTLVDAPYVKEFPVVLECQVIHTLEIGLHTQFIGQIVDVKAEESLLGERGMPDPLQIRPLLFDPGEREYYELGGRRGKAFMIGRNR
jgi:flavin reductase (DIM6/NTAB) family NADH-FMN oxidoreductase RutF